MTRSLDSDDRSRIAPLAVLPLFFNLAGRRVLLVGHSEGALWKAELLVAAGAELHIAAGIDGAVFEPLRDSRPERVRLHPRSWHASDLPGAALAVADFDDEEEARRFAAAAA